MYAYCSENSGIFADVVEADKKLYTSYAIGSSHRDNSGPPTFQHATKNGSVDNKACTVRSQGLIMAVQSAISVVFHLAIISKDNNNIIMVHLM